MRSLWAETVSGRLGAGVRYSAHISYNSFPVPRLSGEQKDALATRALEIILERERTPGKTISWMYNSDEMPPNLLRAHRELDETVESIYMGRGFRNDTERLEHLFKLYSLMTKGAKTVAPAKEYVVLEEVA